MYIIPCHVFQPVIVSLARTLIYGQTMRFHHHIICRGIVAECAVANVDRCIGHNTSGRQRRKCVDVRDDLILASVI